MCTATMKPTTTKFLTGIIPSSWEEFIFEYDDFFMVYVQAETLSDLQWNQYLEKLQSEFGNNLEDCYRLPDKDGDFEVYLVKNKD